MQSKKEDLYDTLGIPKDADQVTIKKAFRKRARKTHPDTTGSTETTEEYHAIVTAYTVLSDPEKKAHYDQTGEDPGFMPKEERIKLAAISKMIATFNGIMQKVGMDRSGNVDLIKETSINLSEEEAHNQQQIRQFREIIKHLNKVKKKLKCKSKTDYISNFLNQEIDKAKQTIAATENNILICEKAKELLQSYEYIVDKLEELNHDPRSTGPQYFTITFE